MTKRVDHKFQSERQWGRTFTLILCRALQQWEKILLEQSTGEVIITSSTKRISEAARKRNNESLIKLTEENARTC
eukprot:2815376-Ditylum_brightwellii.AAC.1